MNNENSESALEIEKAALKGCEEQVLNDVGFIQPFAYLLAYTLKDRTVSHASKNINNCLGKNVQEILGKPLEDILPEAMVHKCNNASSHSTITTNREYVGPIENDNGRHEVYAHKSKNTVILDIQTVETDHSIGLTMLDNVQRILGRLSRLKTPKGLFASAVIEIKQLSQFDRVKVYQFLPDGSGEVIAEEKECLVDSFLGLRFPAFDVPKAARELYAKTPIRVIPDVSAEQVNIVTNIPEKELDLSLSVSRGVVPVHMMYLQNMGVKASMSIPIVVEGKMWGLFACHHLKPYIPGSDVISSCEILGNTIAMMLSAMLQNMRNARTEQCHNVINKLFVPDESALGFTAYWDTTSLELASLLDCDGLALVGSDSFMFHGIHPSVDAIKKLVSAIDDHFDQIDAQSTVFFDESLKAHFPDFDTGKTAGLIAIPNPLASYKYLLFFRNEAKDGVHWAGRPDKQIDKDNETYRLNPRASFSEYISENTEYCQRFSNEDLFVAEALKDALYNMTANVMTRTSNRERLGLMVRELNHRVRNILALISSIVSQSRSDSHSLEQFVESLESRIQALSETHKLLTEFAWQPIHISLLFERALSPFIVKKQKRITLRGEHISLPPELASLFALVIHELASNAIKYGSLSVPQGYVELSWEADEQNLRVTWKENEGPRIIPPKTIGFGTTLINEALTYEFDADCELSFEPQGVVASFVVPHINSKIAVPHKAAIQASTSIVQTKFRAFVLEDDYMISKDTCAMLKNLGASSIDAAASIAKAHALLNENEYDIAVLDANIKGEFSGEIAKQLNQLRVPYLFVTGYGSKDQALHETNCIDVLTKPISEEELYNSLRQSKVIKK